MGKNEGSVSANDGQLFDKQPIISLQTEIFSTSEKFSCPENYAWIFQFLSIKHSIISILGMFQSENVLHEFSLIIKIDFFGIANVRTCDLFFLIN